MKIKPLNIFLLAAIAAQLIGFIPTKAEAAKKSDHAVKVFNTEKQAREYICEPLKGNDNSLCKMALQKIGSKRFSQLGQTTKSAPKKVVKDMPGVCKTKVTNTLKSPASAKYPSKPQTREIFQGIYVVTGKVDSQNKYGALLRKGYHCYMYYSSDNKLQLMGTRLLE
ncbi:hypothetical protein [Calothrix sp. CCY 0018]|uniref:hypothetical protein n=1 Tax=Calothrix sp. CCY 0018 TaxID=3103864 RepID=UPI0039C60E71